MSACRELSFIDAPIHSVWALVGDPRRFPEWWPRVIEVRGEPIEEGTEYVQVTKSPGGATTTRFLVEARDELREIRMRCTLTGYYAHWRLTSGQGGTFTEVEFGMDPERPSDKVFDVVLGRIYWRRWLKESVQALQARAQAQV